MTYDYDSAPTSYSGQTGYWVGRLAKVTDASGTHEFIYDEQGRTLKDKKTVSATGYEFVRTYDSMGRVRTLTYPDTEVVTYTYNGFGDVETISGLKSAVTTHYVKDVDYNPSGQITHLQYGNDVTSDYSYDADTLRLENILTKKPDGTTKLQDLAYTFDNNGNVATIADTINNMSQSFTYDDLNRLTQAVGSAYGTQSFSYDPIGNMTNKAGRGMNYGSAAGPHAVDMVFWTGSNYPSFCRDFQSGGCTMEYDANGNMTKRGQDVLSYDSENRLKEMTVREGVSDTQTYTLKPGWNVISFTYLPDNKAVSNVMSGLTFGTDYNQISTWDSASGTWKHWLNDADFNDFTEFQYGKTYEIYVNSGTDESLSVTGISNGADLTHNIVSGDNFISPAVKTATNISTVLASLTLDTHYSDVKRFNAATQTWQSYDNGDFTQFEPGKGYNIVGLTNASFSYGKSETTTTFVYDSSGDRVKKIVGGTTTVYLGMDYDITASTSTKYIFLGDMRIATKDSSGALQYIHQDHINSSNIITDASGNQAALLEYDPYGSTVTQTGSADPKHKFTGKELDSTRLYYFGARYMDPQLGRFVSADPTINRPEDPQDFNRYAYCRNNPIRFTDPTGLSWLSKNFKKIFKAVLIIIAIVLIVYAVASLFQAWGAYAAGSAGSSTAGGLGGAGGVSGAGATQGAAQTATFSGLGTGVHSGEVVTMASFTAPAAPAAASGTSVAAGVGTGLAAGSAGTVMLDSSFQKPISDKQTIPVHIDASQLYSPPVEMYAHEHNLLPFFIIGGGGMIGPAGGSSGAAVQAVSMPVPASVPGGRTSLGVNQGYSLEGEAVPEPKNEGYKPLTKGEIKRLNKKIGDVHKLKPRSSGFFDLFKNKKGDVFIGRKGGKGPLDQPRNQSKEAIPL